MNNKEYLISRLNLKFKDIDYNIDYDVVFNVLDWSPVFISPDTISLSLMNRINIYNLREWYLLAENLNATLNTINNTFDMEQLAANIPRFHIILTEFNKKYNHNLLNSVLLKKIICLSGDIFNSVNYNSYLNKLILDTINTDKNLFIMIKKQLGDFISDIANLLLRRDEVKGTDLEILSYMHEETQLTTFINIPIFDTSKISNDNLHSIYMGVFSLLLMENSEYTAMTNSESLLGLKTILVRMQEMVLLIIGGNILNSLNGNAELIHRIDKMFELYIKRKNMGDFNDAIKEL